MQLNFYKYQGTGNDFILIDDRHLTFPIDDIGLIAHLCDRKFGIGADGLILLQPHASQSYFMKYYNSDGKESSMCGNGGRCLAAFALHIGIAFGKHSFMAIDGIHDVEPEGDINKAVWIKLKMKDVEQIEIRENNIFILNTGSPHYVQFNALNIDSLNIVADAKSIRYSQEYTKEGINVNFVNLIGINEISMRTYERGVENETLSCGTGVTAAALSSAVLNNFPNGLHTTNVNTPGGRLKVTFYYNVDNSTFDNVWLQGPATLVFKGTVEI
jgi:diaminopimelate epimerase